MPDLFEPNAPPAPGPRVDVDYVLGDRGPFAERVPGYENRAGQMAYARAVEACLDPQRNPDGTPLLIEGPTGTGKTLGYLIPAIGSVLTRRFRAEIPPGEPDWKYRRRVLVVTANIALQEQLIQKDLPFIQRTTGWDFRYALLKGRSNFGCHHAVEELKEADKQKGLFEDSLGAEVQRLREWFERSQTGDKSEIDPSPMGAVWSLFTSTSDECSGKKCAFYTPCHYYSQRRAAWKSDVIVTNYAFLLTEIVMRMETGSPSVLMPEFDIVVCDEAHDLGEIARRFFATEIRSSQFAQIGRLLGGARLNMKTEAGKAYELARAWNDLAQVRLDTAGGSVIYDPARFRTDAEIVSGVLDEIVKAVGNQVLLYKRTNGLAGLSAADLPEGHRRIIDAMERPATMAENIISALDVVFPKPPAPDAQPVGTPEKMVYYIDSAFGDDKDRRKNYSFVACPFSAGERLKAALWDQCENVILTSATMATRLKADSGSRFGFVRNDLGLGSTICFEEIVESPFDTQANMGVYIDASINPQDENRSTVVQRIVSLLRASRGRALILFTSYKAMNEVHSLVSMRVPYRCYRQGESSRSILTARFRDDVTSCLFATRSFFQGIDVQGESLSLLILDRIPFPGMHDPFIETAKVEGERAGKKWAWFDQHSIPRAMMAFRQAIGRLIRTKTDRGVVAVLDGRIAANGGKPYGRMFRDAIPSTQYLADPAAVAVFFGTDLAAAVAPAATDPLPPEGSDDDVPF